MTQLQFISIKSDKPVNLHTQYILVRKGNHRYILTLLPNLIVLNTH